MQGETGHDMTGAYTVFQKQHVWIFVIFTGDLAGSLSLRLLREVGVSWDSGIDQV